MSDELSTKSIDADYYNIADTESWPVAGLLVLLDGREQPVRSELHLFDELPSHIQEGAIRQARDILQDTYSGDTTVPLKVLQTSQLRDAVNVRLSEEASDTASSNGKVPVALYASIAVVALIAVIVVLAITVGGSTLKSPLGVLSREAQTPLSVVQEMVAASPTLSAGQESMERLTDALPPSRNARSDLDVGMRVAIVPDLRLTLRSEPGGQSGVPLGYMMDDDTALIIGGPELAEGTLDTIVWWKVRLDDGIEAWAAANTSNQTLLVPVPAQ